MAKTYIDTVKYVVYSDVEITGLVEKPDVVGAIFGQTEGLLGDELDLRDLQKNGRIGRIEVDLNPRNGKTIGIIKIPSSLDMVETCIIAASLETVDRVGPCEAKIAVTRVEDTRNVKRKVLVERAKDILKTLLNTEIPESREISDIVRDEVKTAEITQYGPDNLPAGPNLQRYKDIIIVEGRADVINLLKNDVPNVVAIQGARVPKSIIKLSKEKEITVFLDGDRGGDIILNELLSGGVDIEYIARAPTGKEVEELTRKELIKCLRSKVSCEQGQDSRSRQNSQQNERQNERVEFEREYQGEKPAEKFERRERPVEKYERPQERQFERQPERRPERDTRKPIIVPQASIQQRTTVEKKIIMPIISRESVQRKIVVEPENVEVAKPAKKFSNVTELVAELDELNNTLRARFYNQNLETIKEVPVRDVIKSLEEISSVHAIVFDGIITQRLVDLAANKGVTTLIGIKIGNVNKKPQNLNIMTKTN
ncbi:MAG: DNA primase DnaG [Candidatus Micrarchaeota archaeon]